MTLRDAIEDALMSVLEECEPKRLPKTFTIRLPDDLVPGDGKPIRVGGYTMYVEYEP